MVSICSNCRLAGRATPKTCDGKQSGEQNYALEVIAWGGSFEVWNYESTARGL